MSNGSRCSSGDVSYRQGVRAMTVFKVHIKGLGGYTTPDLSTVTEDLRVLQEEGDAGSLMTVEIVEMSQEELDALPEFQGF